MNWIELYCDGKTPKHKFQRQRIVMPLVSLSIPIFNTKYDSVNRQLEIRQKELEAQKENRKNELDTQLR